MALRATTMRIKALVRVWEHRYPLRYASRCMINLKRLT